MTLTDIWFDQNPTDHVRLDSLIAPTVTTTGAPTLPEPPIRDEPTLSSFARCSDGNGTLTHLFFSDDEFDVARAKAICSKCGLAPNCLSVALDRGEPYGVWGGQLVIDGVVVAVKRGRGRPPKTPRPVLVVDEVPVPPHLVA